MRIAFLVILIFSFCLIIAGQAQAFDRDGMPSWWEKKYHLNPNQNDGRGDPDLDGLSNRREWRLRINPRSKDSDQDGIDDGVEVRFGFNPRQKDADKDKDGDGVSNIDETRSVPGQDNVPTPQPSNSGQRGLFVVNCSLTERKNLDPIIAPGRPGTIHSHDFFGPLTVDDGALPGDLINQPTSCGVDGDRSAYWMPTLYNGGQAQAGGVLQAYYFISDQTRPYPRQLAMLAGKPTLTVSNPQSASWSCQPSSNYGQTSLPPCPAGQYILSEIRFPPCWNGRDLDSSDHRSHMAYFIDGRCPTSHPVELPELVLFRTFTQYQGLLDQTSLSSGSTGGLHGDFVSGWNEQVLSDLINSCRGRNCSVVGQQRPPSLSNKTDAAEQPRLVSRLFCRLKYTR